jgi:hypothetical protein
MNDLSEREKLLMDLLKKERVLAQFMADVLHTLLELSAAYAKDAPKMIDEVLKTMKEIEEKYPEVAEYDKDESS